MRTEKRALVYAAIDIERRLQEKYLAAGKFAYTCASNEMTPAEKLSVLAEEYGEAAHEVNEGIGSGRSVNVDKLRSELIQIAAVAVAWIESLEVTFIREIVFEGVDFEFEKRSATLTSSSACGRFALLSYYYSHVCSATLLEMSTITEAKEFERTLARLVASCVEWIEFLEPVA